MKSIIIAGDFFPVKINHEYFASGDILKLFDLRIIELFLKADFSICNLEGVLTDCCVPIKKAGPNIRANGECINAFSKLNLSCASIANNHIADFGKRGFDDTIRLLSENNIDYLGTKEKHIKTFNICGKKISFYTVSETMFNTLRQGVDINLYDEFFVCQEINHLKSQVDYLVVLYHGGMEFFEYVTPELKKRFHRMADSGADVVLAQHTHAISCREHYNNSYLLYGQGDFQFAFGNHQRIHKKNGIIVELEVSSESIEVKEHLIEHSFGYTKYAECQSLSDFEIRNSRLADGDTFDAEFAKYAEERMLKWIDAFAGKKNFLENLLIQLHLRRRISKRMLLKYQDPQVLRIISGIEFEEFRELLLKGLWSRVIDN